MAPAPNRNPRLPAEPLPADLLRLLAYVWGGQRMIHETAHLQRADAAPGSPHIGERVRTRRIGSGWSIMEAACRAGILALTWQGIERGDVAPSSVEITRVARVLNTTVDELVAAGAERRHPGAGLPLAS